MGFKPEVKGWRSDRVKVWIVMKWYAHQELNQEESKQDIDGMNEELIPQVVMHIAKIIW